MSVFQQSASCPSGDKGVDGTIGSLGLIGPPGVIGLPGADGDIGLTTVVPWFSLFNSNVTALTYAECVLGVPFPPPPVPYVIDITTGATYTNASDFTYAGNDMTYIGVDDIRIVMTIGCGLRMVDQDNFSSVFGATLETSIRPNNSGTDEYFGSGKSFEFEREITNSVYTEMLGGGIMNVTNGDTIGMQFSVASNGLVGELPATDLLEISNVWMNAYAIAPEE
jgi:hypothetical protein